jgi:hypothetical protein
VKLNSNFGFGGKVDKRSFETVSSHLSPRNEPMNTNFRDTYSQYIWASHDINITVFVLCFVWREGLGKNKCKLAQ